MKVMEQKVQGNQQCPICNGFGKIRLFKIPFTEVYLWEECSECWGTGDKHRGFVR